MNTKTPDELLIIGKELFNEYLNEYAKTGKPMSSKFNKQAFRFLFQITNLDIDLWTYNDKGEKVSTSNTGYTGAQEILMRDITISLIHYLRHINYSEKKRIRLYVSTIVIAIIGIILYIISSTIGGYDLISLVIPLLLIAVIISSLFSTYKSVNSIKLNKEDNSSLESTRLRVAKLYTKK